MSREDPQMKIRLPAELKTSIEGAAKAAGRTLNAEIVARLQSSFAFPNGDSADKVALLQFVIQMSLKHINDPEVVEAIGTLRNYTGADEADDEKSALNSLALTKLLDRHLQSLTLVPEIK